MATGRADRPHRLTAVVAPVAAEQLHSMGEERHESGKNARVIHSINSLMSVCVFPY